MTNNLTVNWIAPASGKGELTFSVVDNEQQVAVALYPASELENGAKSTNDQILDKFRDDLNLSINWIAPASGKGELTFSVVDNDQQTAVVLYPASELKNGAGSTKSQILDRFYGEYKPVIA